MGATAKASKPRARIASLDAIAAKCDGATDFIRELAAPHVDQDDYADVVLGMARTLPDDHAEVFQFRWLNDLAIEEIARRTDRASADVEAMLAESHEWIRESTAVEQRQAEATRRAIEEREQARNKVPKIGPCKGCGYDKGTYRNKDGLCWTCEDKAAKVAPPSPAPPVPAVKRCTGCGVRGGKFRSESGLCWNCNERQGRADRLAAKGEIRPAAPCIDCGTTGGYVTRVGMTPVRIKGRCQACNGRMRKRELREKGRSDRQSPPVAPPCLGCGTIGGTVDPGCKRPARTKGLCKPCYVKKRKREAALRLREAGSTRPLPGPASDHARVIPASGLSLDPLFRLIPNDNPAKAAKVLRCLADLMEAIA